MIQISGSSISQQSAALLASLLRNNTNMLPIPVQNIETGMLLINNCVFFQRNFRAKKLAIFHENDVLSRLS